MIEARLFRDCDVQRHDSGMKLSIPTVAKSVDEARPPGIAKYRATTAPEASRSLILEPCRMLRSLSSKFSPVQGSTACGWTGRAGEGAFGLLVERHLEGGRVELAVEGAFTGLACGSQNPDVKADCWSAVSRRLISSVACRRSSGRICVLECKVLRGRH